MKILFQISLVLSLIPNFSFAAELRLKPGETRTLKSGEDVSVSCGDQRVATCRIHQIGNRDYFVIISSPGDNQNLGFYRDLDPDQIVSLIKESYVDKGVCSAIEFKDRSHSNMTEIYKELSK